MREVCTKRPLFLAGGSQVSSWLSSSVWYKLTVLLQLFEFVCVMVHDQLKETYLGETF